MYNGNREKELNLKPIENVVELYIHVLKNLCGIKAILYKEVLVGEFNSETAIEFSQKIISIEKKLFDNVSFFKHGVDVGQDYSSNILNIFEEIGQLLEDLKEMSNSETSCWNDGGGGVSITLNSPIIEYMKKLNGEKYLEIAKEIEERKVLIEKVNTAIPTNTISENDDWD